MDLGELVNRVVPFDFTHEDFTVKGEYYRYKITPQYLVAMKKLREGAEEPDDVEYQVMSDLIRSWDLTRGGEEFPPTAENLKKIPAVYLVPFGAYLGALSAGNPTNGAASVSGS